MNNRTISALAFAVIIFVEVMIFVFQPTLTKDETTFIPKRNDSLFGGARTEVNTIIDTEAEKARNTKFGIIIGASLILGGIVTFSIPNTKTANTGS